MKTLVTGGAGFIGSHLVDGFLPAAAGARRRTTGAVQRAWADPAAARRELGFSCGVTFEEGLRTTVESFKP